MVDRREEGGGHQKSPRTDAFAHGAPDQFDPKERPSMCGRVGSSVELIITNDSHRRAPPAAPNVHSILEKACPNSRARTNL